MNKGIESPYKRATEGLRIKVGAPQLQRPTKEEIEQFSKEAQKLIETNRISQKEFLEKNHKYNLEKLKGKHFLIAGATGQGLGCSLACAAMELVKERGSLTILSRDLKKSLGFETGVILKELASKNKLGDRFHWSNNGLALEGPNFAEIVKVLKAVKAKEIIYINTVASASSGLQEGFPKVYVKDYDEEGLFEWELKELSTKELETTKLFMGDMAVEYAEALEKAGIDILIRVFADWRGSLDRESRSPDSLSYGRQGAYSTSLYLPKDIIQERVSKWYGEGRKRAIDIFFPIMQTRALSFIPGGKTMGQIFSNLLSRQGLNVTNISELSLQALEVINKNISEEDKNPFPRLDLNELATELWFYEVVSRLNNKEGDRYYYKAWI